MPASILRSALLGCLFIFLAGLPALAQDVPVAMHDGPPEQGTVPLELEELWRAGGMDDEDIIFGQTPDIICDKAGHTFVLDHQLCQVAVFSAEGELLRTIGREGDGPGELRQPMGLAMLGDDLLGIGIGFPGKVVTMRLDGTPVGTLYPIGVPSEGNIGVMMSLQAADGWLCAGGARLMFTSPEDASSLRFLSAAPLGQEDFTRLLEKTNPLDPLAHLYDEAADYYWDLSWALGPEGTLYVPRDRDRYEISVFGSDGTLQRVFGRQTPSRKRSQEEKDRVRPIINVNNAQQDRDWQICDTDPAISRIAYNFDDDTVWVLTPGGSSEQPEGILETWDVFSPDGRYLRRVPIPLGHEMNEGTSFLVGGGRLIVLRGSTSAPGESDEELEAEEEPEPLEVICYRIK